MHVDSQKLKADQKFIGWAWSNMVVASVVTLKLTVSQNWTDGITWFLHAGTNLGRLKVGSIIFLMGFVKNGSFFLVHEILKPTVS